MTSEVHESLTDDSNPLRALLICRSSCRATKAIESREVDGQEARLRDWLDHNFFKPVEITCIKVGKEMESGDSACELAMKHLRSREFDLLLVESIDRIARGWSCSNFSN